MCANQQAHAPVVDEGHRNRRTQARDEPALHELTGRAPVDETKVTSQPHTEEAEEVARRDEALDQEDGRRSRRAPQSPEQPQLEAIGEATRGGGGPEAQMREALQPERATTRCAEHVAFIEAQETRARHDAQRATAEFIAVIHVDGVGVLSRRTNLIFEAMLRPMNASQMLEALSSPPPRSLEGSAPYLGFARRMYRVGMAGALLFCTPFVVMTVTGPNTVEEIVSGIINIALFWVLPPVLFLRFRMRHINRLWREGRLTPGVVNGNRPPPHLRGPVVASTPGYFLVSFTSHKGQRRAATFIGEYGDFPPGTVPQLLVVDEIEHRVGLVGARHLLIAVSVTGDAARMISQALKPRR